PYLFTTTGVIIKFSLSLVWKKQIPVETSDKSISKVLFPSWIFVEIYCYVNARGFILNFNF
ncbi:MAG: hypothetical protein ACKVJP_11685, partial [Flavobacteriales bacterium]